MVEMLIDQCWCIFFVSWIPEINVVHAGQRHRPYLLVLLVAALRVFAPLQVMLAVLSFIPYCPTGKAVHRR